MNEKIELHEMTKDEMAQIEGGTWMEFLDMMAGAMTGGFIGYGSGGFEGYTHTVYKNKPGSNNNP